MLKYFSARVHTAPSISKYFSKKPKCKINDRAVINKHKKKRFDFFVRREKKGNKMPLGS